MQAQIFAIPAEMSSISTATVLETANGDVLICHDESFLYATKMMRAGSSVVFQKFNLPCVTNVLPVIKNYFMVLFSTQKLVVFEVSFSEDGKVMLKFIFNKERQYASFFLREVVDNMAELQVFYPDNEIFIQQFTVKGKIGNMVYALTNQNKLKTCERQQMYGSKTMLALHKKTLYSFANFSNKFVSAQDLQKLQIQLFKTYNAYVLAYVCLSKIEEFYLVLSNLYVVNCTNPTQRHKIMCDVGHLAEIQKLCSMKNEQKQNNLKIMTYFDCVLIEDILRQTTYVFQVKQKGSSLVGVERGKFNWFWTSSSRLIGLSIQRTLFKIIQSIRLSPKNIEKTNKIEDGIEANQSPKNSKSPNQKQTFRLKNQGQSSQKQVASHLKIQDCQQRERAQMFKVDEPMIEIPEQQKPTEMQIAKPVKMPNRIIQKNKVSVSKTVQKSRQIEPISNNKALVVPQQQYNDKPQQKQPSEQIQFANETKNLKQDNKKQQTQNLNVQAPSHTEQSNQKETYQQDEDRIQDNNQKFNNIINLLQSPPQQQHENKQPPQLQINLQKTQFQKQQTSTPQQPQIQTKNDLAKSHSMLMGKFNSGTVPIDPLNLFNTSINRNNIFGPPINRNNIFSFNNKPQNQTADGLFPLTKHHSQNNNFNPFMTQPFPLPKPPNLQILIQKDQHKDTSINHQRSEFNQNQELIPRVKKLFKETTDKLLKSLEQMNSSNTIEPYIKQRLKQQLHKKIIQSLKSTLAGDFTNRLQRFFSQIFKQSNQVQQESIKFYKQASLHKSACIQVQLANQQKILKQIKDIEGMMKFCMVNMKQQSIECFQNMVRDWNTNMKQTNIVVSNLMAIKDKIENQQNIRNKRYEETKIALDSIKQLLIERVNIEEAKKQQRIAKEAARLVQEKKKRKFNKNKSKSKILSGDKVRRVKTKKQSQND